MSGGLFFFSSMNCKIKRLVSSKGLDFVAVFLTNLKYCWFFVVLNPSFAIFFQIEANFVMPKTLIRNSKFLCFEDDQKN